MATNITKLSTPYFVDSSTQLNAATLNPIIAKINEMIDVINSGVTPTPTPTQTVTAPTIYIRDIAIIMDGESGSTIRYTTDGTTPTASSTLYEGAFTLEGDSPITIKAKAFKNSGSSDVATAIFTPRQDASIIAVVEGTKFTLLTSASGKIQYSINDSSEWTNYTEPVTVTNTDKIRARKWIAASSSYIYVCAQCTASSSIIVSQRYTEVFEHARIKRTSSAEGFLNVAGTSQSVRIYAYAIERNRKYIFATTLATSTYAYWGYLNSLPASIAESDDLELAGKLGTDMTPDSRQTFDVTAENFSYLCICDQGSAGTEMFAEIIK